MFAWFKYLNPFYWRKMHQLEQKALKETEFKYRLLRQDIQDIYYWMSADPRFVLVHQAAHWTLLRDIARRNHDDEHPLQHPLERISDVSGLREHLGVENRVKAIQEAVKNLNLSDNDLGVVREYITEIKRQGRP